MKKNAAWDVSSAAFFYLFIAVSDAFVQICNQSVYVNAVCAGTFADCFEVSGHAADASETISLEYLHNLRIFLDSFDDTCVFGNNWHVNSSLKILFRTF